MSEFTEEDKWIFLVCILKYTVEDWLDAWYEKGNTQTGVSQA